MEAQAPYILVIDDEPTLRNVIHDVLTDEGYRVSTHAVYFQEIDEVAELGPDLIILDIMRGDKPAGIDFITRLKADPRSAMIPICVCTGATHLTDAINAQLKDWDCLMMCKPFDIDDFMGEINRCLAHHHLEPSAA